MEDRIKPKQFSANNLPECEHPPVEIIIYICPTEGCSNYYAAPTFRPDFSDIESMQYTRSQNDGSMREAHPRTECPDCRVSRGIHVNRKPYVVTEIVSLEEVRKAIVQT